MARIMAGRTLLAVALAVGLVALLAVADAHGASGPSAARHRVRSGFTPSGSAGSSGPGTARIIFFDHASTSYASQVELQIDAVATHKGVAVRCDVQTIWIPKRPPYSFVHHPTSAYVVVKRDGSQPTVRRTVGPTRRRTSPERRTPPLSRRRARAAARPPTETRPTRSPSGPRPG